MTTTFARAALLLLPLLAVACSPETRRTELYFGLSSLPEAQRGPITDQEFQQFLDAEVTPRFPEGYTVLSGEGRWGDRGKTMTENSRVLVLYRPAGEEVSARVDAIRDAYKSRFKQQAVLRVDVQAKGAF